jgi:hypothetical protein
LNPAPFVAMLHASALRRARLRAGHTDKHAEGDDSMSDQRPAISLRAADVGSATPPPTHEVTIVGTPRRIKPGAARDAGPGVPPVAVAPDEVVRVEYDNGLALWMRADDLLRERGRKNVARGDGSEVWDIDASPRIGLLGSDADAARGGERGAERGVLGLGIKALEFFGVDLQKKSAAIIGKTFEERQLKGATPGRLYRCTLGSDAAMVPVADGAKTLPAERPLLVFLHGTMSSVRGSFGDLWAAGKDEAGQAAAAARESIKARYGTNVFAFEHRTLTESPIRNALALVEQLPVGAQLHLVSHSRGGLVGELLCLAERDPREDPLQPDLLEALFKTDRTVAEQIGLGPLEADAAKARDAAYAQDREQLVALLKALDAKQIRVCRFVRVACPARGTTLASGRLDRWLSVINLLTGNGLVGDVADFLLAVVKQRTDPRTLPGVEAMMPGSALTRLLHHPALVSAADLSVIGGDIEGEGLWSQLKLLAVDWFYSAEHDLVVNTGSMLGGIRRPEGGARFLRDQGPEVTHFNYFGNRKSLGWLLNGLAREDGTSGGFAPIGEAKQEEPRWRAAVRASRSATTPRPVAVVIPGTMGSALDVKGKPVWLAYWALLRGGLEDIGWGASDVAPVDLLDDFYGPLLEHLARTHRVEIFPYDWRGSVRDAAQGLAAKLEALLLDAESSKQPIHIVAHSMGGLVTRSMIADGGAGERVWRRITALPGSRFLMLGTPNLGSHEAVRWLTGFNPTEAKLALLDFTRGVNGVIDIVRRFPGVVELLPFADDPNPFAQVALWKKLRADLFAGWKPVDEPLLRAATTTWSLMRNAPPDPRFMVYVAGCQPATVIDYQLVDEEQFTGTRKKIEWIATPEGDGTVPWASGRLPGVTMYFAPDTGHDQLCSNTDDRRIFRGYVELLTTGRTDQLSTTPPGRARAAGMAAERFVLPPLPVADDIPDADAVRSLGFGGGRPRRRGAAAQISSVIEVSVRHGDLAYARFPVLVGHYLGDTIVSAELALDRRLQGALSRRLDIGLYPGRAGTHAVFFNEDPDRSPKGAVVVGLGQVGELSPTRLETGVRDALLEYALQLALRPAPPLPDGSKPDPAPKRASVSCLLVGTGAGSLQLRDSIEAMLRGALAANRKLEDARLDRRVLIDRLEILELYEDLAIAAAKELAVVLESAELATRLRWPARCVEEGEGRHLRRRFDADQSWWQRIEIVEEAKADRLRFIATADRARAEETLATGQLRLADAFIAQASASATANPDVAKTLFEMLLPNRLKESAPDQRDIVLLLDSASARFPWELLEDRWSRTGRPPAVVGGMVRQLKTGEFRMQPAHALENTVFVVGNPDLDEWRDFADLPGARREAERVRDVFGRKGYTTVSAIDEKAQTIVSALHSNAWRVLHLAGHGEHEFLLTEEAEAPVAAAIQAEAAETATALGVAVRPTPGTKRVSGMVIGRNTFLTPGDIEQMRHVPELVFINCCHLGKTQQRKSTDMNRLAANLGVQFIRMGVRAVIAAGWAVDDDAALSFADAFYNRLLDGDTFGQSVLAARRAAWAGHPGANTWGAYQCYGDPGYRLHRNEHAPAASPDPEFYAPAELVAELRNLAESARMRSKESDDAAVTRWLRGRIDALLARMPDHERERGREGWLGRSDVAAALGFAYGEGGLFADAVQWLDDALAASPADCPVRAVEQCANFKVRLAAQEWAELRAADPGGATGAHALELRDKQAALAERIEESIRELDLINLRSQSPERLALLGGACKRLAWVQTERQPRIEALLNMAQYYRQAFDLCAQDDSYALNNWGTGCLLLAAIDPQYAKGDWQSALADLCKRQAELNGKRNDEDPTLWLATGLADLEVVQLLLARDDKAAVAQRGQRATRLYQAAFARGASPREVASIRENVDFLVEMCRGWPAAVRSALDAIRRSL